MSTSLTNSSSFGSSKFDLIKDSMLQANDLPLSEVVDTDQWQEIFDKHEINFGSAQDAVYTLAIMGAVGDNRAVAFEITTAFDFIG